YCFCQSSLACHSHLYRLSGRRGANELKAIRDLHLRRFTAVVSRARLHWSETWREMEPGRHAQDVVPSLRLCHWNYRSVAGGMVDLASHQTPAQRNWKCRKSKPGSLKTERPGLGPAFNRWRETFSLNRSLSSPQQPLANYFEFYK